jgi:SAM-dependent methyltransferase
MIFEQLTPLYAILKKETPHLIGCEFLGSEKIAGQTYEHQGHMVRHEDMLAMSIPATSVDLLMHFDVLEHVADHRMALAECWRVLAPGGSMLVTLPFYTANDTTLIRAQVENGRLKHLLPDVFHGNPVGGGALVVIEAGWEILSDIRATGFDTRMALVHDPEAGIVSNGCPWPIGQCWPIVFHATKV